MFFKKKMKGDHTFPIEPDQIATVVDLKADEVSHTYSVSANSTCYNMLYQNGSFMGLPCPRGGSIYPFSKDPTRQGSKGDKKNLRRATVVIISKTLRLKMYWGTGEQYYMEDPVTHESYRIGAHGVFYLYINNTDAGESARRFYEKCSSGTIDNLSVEFVKTFLAEAFSPEIGAKLEEYLNEKKKSLATYVDVSPSEQLKISADLVERLDGLFTGFGLCIDKEASRRSILEGMIVNEIVKN